MCPKRDHQRGKGGGQEGALHRTRLPTDPAAREMRGAGPPDPPHPLLRLRLTRDVRRPPPLGRGDEGAPPFSPHPALARGRERGHLFSEGRTSTAAQVSAARPSAPPPAPPLPPICPY